MRLRANFNGIAWAALGLAWCVFTGSRAEAASGAEDRAFQSALNSFRGTWWARADQEFDAFIQRYPQSDLRPEAVLYQAQTRYQQTNSTGVVELLLANMAQAGTQAAEYQYWLAEAYFQGSNYLAAAEAYQRLAAQYPDSYHRVESAYDEAFAYSRLGDWSRVAESLSRTNGPFRQAMQANPTNGYVISGMLLLADAHLARNDFHAAEETLQSLAALKLAPALEWQRRYALCRVQQGGGHLEEALQSATELVALAATTQQRGLLSESVAFKASVLELLDRPAEAIAAYEQNIAADVLPERRRQAWLKTIDLTLALGRLDEARQRLEKHLAQYPQDSASDTAALARGELRLRQYLTIGSTNGAPGAPPGANLLRAALAEFDAVLTNAPPSSFAGKAQLDRGWCLWLSNQVAESASAFGAAAQRLPFSEDQAVARFKWADAQYQLKDFRGALTNYSGVVSEFAALPGVRDRLFEPALYQIVRCSLEVNDVAAATNALGRLLAWYPGGFLCPPALLLAGQQLSGQGDPAGARQVFAEFEKRFFGSPLLPEVRLAAARAFEREGNWDGANAVYSQWVKDFPDAPARPRVEYSLAWVNYQAGHETNALGLLTNLVAQFPTNAIVPQAQFWVGDYYFNRGEFEKAEAVYQELFKKWTDSDLRFAARMMAGRTAVARTAFNDANGYFTGLINDTNCPPGLVAQALFAYGDATLAMPSPDTNQPLANYREAIKIFRKLQSLFPTHELVAPTAGRIGACYLQLAVEDPTQYSLAAQAFQSAMTNSQASFSVRSEAEVGLAIVLDKQAANKPKAEQEAARKDALDHCLNVAFETQLRDGERADPFWVKKAGLEAARLAEDLQLWEQAGKLYERLIELLPSLRPTLETKLLKVRERLSRPGD